VSGEEGRAISELEHALADLAAWIEFPPTPDVASHIEAKAPQRPFWRRPLAVVLAVVIVAVGAVFAASSGARTAVLDWFGIGGVHLQRVPRLTDVPLRTTAPFGRPTTLEDARKAVGFRVRIPHLDGLGSPSRVYLDETAPEGLVTLVYGRPSAPSLLLSQWQANTRVYFYKLLTYSTAARRVRVNGGPGVWISGAPHQVFYRGAGGFSGATPVYLAGNVLVWMEGSISHRLEADVSLRDALTIADSLD
jgi:hypothetical protein